MAHLPDDLLHGFIDKEIDRSRSRTVDAHLKSCVSCKKRHDDLLLLNRLIIDTGGRRASDNFTAVVMNKIADLPAPSTAFSNSGSFLSMPRVFAAALTLFAVVLTLSYNSGEETDSEQTAAAKPLSMTGQIMEKYLSESIEHTASFIKRLTGMPMGGSGDSSPMLMMLFFVGSILIYQVLELLQDWLRQRRSSINLLV
ncbi:MAG: zf-HC2 domain-containing protein [Candidatus Marinimicrobia bacterium]|nr:zf-HC2 domain-containing protein [Candidatus Neomarinimicrobiota bacterium]